MVKEVTDLAAVSIALSAPGANKYISIGKTLKTSNIII